MREAPIEVVGGNIVERGARVIDSMDVIK